MNLRIVIASLIVALVGTNLFWMYVVFDQGVTQTYLDASLQLTTNQLEQTTILSNLDLKGLSAERAIETIGKDVYGFKPFVKEGCIVAGGVCVILEDNRVVGIGNGAL